MAISKSSSMRFTPRGLVDAFDATDKFPGACQALANLVFDPSNPELVITRPGVTQLCSFTAGGFTNPGFISVHGAVGTRIYGMIATARNAGKDEPFCYDTGTGAFVTISGVTGANCPTSPTSSGDWVPPTIASVGTMILITHPGFSGSVGVFFGIIDVTNPAAPAWSCANTVTTLLPGVPVAVANFNNRAYFACPPAAGQPANHMYYTDVLTNPPTITNATQFLVIGDANPVNALSGLPMQTTSSGILQTLTVFKNTQCWQVAGDTTTSNLSLNYISLTVGTNAPRSVVQSPYGIYFSSTGGPYFIDLLGTLRGTTHSLQELEPDIQAPFENAVSPTRWAGAYNSTIYRVCGSTVVQGRQSTNDYWFDEHRRRWNGPHSFAYDCASALSGYFVLSSVNNPGILIQSTPVQPLNFIDTDLGTSFNINLLSSTFPKVDWMAMKQVAESQIELASSECLVNFTLTAEDDQGNTLESAVIQVTTGGAVWDQFSWGDGTLWGCPQQVAWGSGIKWGAKPVGSGIIWGSGIARRIPHTYPVPWPAPLVFEKMQLQVTTGAAANVAVGTFYARYQRTGYMVIK
jgi:hypothetical protein